MSRLHFLVGFVVTLMTYTASNGLDVLCIFQIIRGFFRMMTFILFQFDTFSVQKLQSFSQRQCLSQLWEVVCKSAKSPKKSVEIKNVPFFPAFAGNPKPYWSQNVEKLFENYLKYLIRIQAFPLIFVLLKMTCLITMFGLKLQVCKNSLKSTIFGNFS